MIQRTVKKINKLLLLAAALPFVYGCGGGGGAALLGSLFGIASGTAFAGGSGGSGGGLLGDALTGGGEALATIHNPEPATMVLLGTGMMAMGYFKNRSSKQR